MSFVSAVVPKGKTVLIVTGVTSGMRLSSLPVIRGPVVGLVEGVPAVPIGTTVLIVSGVTSDMILLSFPVARVAVVEATEGAMGGK